ncbi:MAG: S9 family peptidase [Planctomycetota bacterium]|nr:S9 family peptidase [Planctomycetota bacterium]
MTGKRRITAEDLNRLSVLTEVRISPDGERVAYTVQEAWVEEDKYRSNIYLVPATGGESVAFTHGDHQNTSPCFSRDGKWLAFVSDRSGKPQIWAMPTSGGEPRQLTSRPDGVISGPEFSPDGDRIVFVFRQKDVDEKDAKTDEEKKAIQRAKNAPRVVTRLRYKEEGWGFVPKERDHLWVVSVADGETKQITDGPYDHMGPHWSPDGKEILFAANRAEDPDFELNGIDIWTIPAEGGDVRKLPTQNGPASMPAFSADGKQVAYMGHSHPGDTWGMRNDRIWTTRPGGSQTCLTEDIDRPFGDWTIGDLRGAFHGGPPPSWSSDGKWIYAVLSDRGNTHLVVLPSSGGASKMLVGGNLDVAGYDVSADGKRAALLIIEPLGPGDVFSCAIDGDQAGATERLTHLNEGLLAELDLPEPEPFQFKNSDDITVDGWVIKPPGFSHGKKHPMIFQIHGGPHGQYGNIFFHEFQLLAAEGYVVYYTNPRGSQGYGEAFASAIDADWGNKDYKDVMEAVDAIVAEGYVDESRMGIAGGSYGGYMTNWVIGHTDRFKAAVTMRSVTNLESMFGSSDFGFELRNEFGGFPWENREGYRSMSPITYVDKINTPLLIIHSEEDHRCPIEQAEQLYAALRSMKREVVFIRYAAEGHGLSRGGSPAHRLHRLNHVVSWFKEHL